MHKKHQPTQDQRIVPTHLLLRLLDSRSEDRAVAKAAEPPDVSELLMSAATLAGMMSDPIIASSPVKEKRISHIAIILHAHAKIAKLDTSFRRGGRY